LPGSNVNRIQKTHYLVDLKKSTNTDAYSAGWVHEKRAGTDDLSVTLRDSTGLERLTRYMCGPKKVWEATPSPKVLGIISP